MNFSKLPISICFFTSTKGHFGHKDVYRKTLLHLDRQLSLDSFGGKFAHIKVTPGEEDIALEMAHILESWGFEVEQTVASWHRGNSHQSAYMSDVVKLSKNPAIYHQPYVLWLEDDSTITPRKTGIWDLLGSSCQRLKEDNELVSVRLLRKGDLASSPMVEPMKEGDNFFYSPHFNFQPAILRSRDFYLACKVVEDNPGATAVTQCEMLWRFILANFSRSDKKHMVYHPGYAETIHLGTPEYPNLVKELSL